MGSDCWPQCIACHGEASFGCCHVLCVVNVHKLLLQDVPHPQQVWRQSGIELSRGEKLSYSLALTRVNATLWIATAYQPLQHDASSGLYEYQMGMPFMQVADRGVHVSVQLLSKQPGYHRPAVAAPAAQMWAQSGPTPSHHAGWGTAPAPQYQQQQQQPQPQQARIYFHPLVIIFYTALFHTIDWKIASQ